jgi:hypothetical protein
MPAVNAVVAQARTCEARAAFAIAVLATVAGIAGCLQPASRECGNGGVCPEGERAC